MQKIQLQGQKHSHEFYQLGFFLSFWIYTYGMFQREIMDFLHRIIFQRKLVKDLYVKARKPVLDRKTILRFVESFCATSETADKTHLG